MTVPDYQSLMLPVLVQSASDEVRIGDVVDRLADQLKLSEDDFAELIPSENEQLIQIAIIGQNLSQTSRTRGSY